MSKLFSSKRREASTQAGTFTAEEGLSLVPLVAMFLTLIIIPAEVCIAECMCFLAMSDMLDLFVGVPHGVATADLLQEAAVNLLTLCIGAGWKSNLHTKHHWLTHLKKHLRKFEESGLERVLPNCFVNERKHKLSRRYGGDIASTRTFELSVLQELLCHDLATLEVRGLSNLM